MQPPLSSSTIISKRFDCHFPFHRVIEHYNKFNFLTQNFYIIMYNKLFQNKVTVTNEVTGEENVDENALQGTTTPKDTLWSVVLE